MQNLIAIRPHHFLCLPGYKGYGYSKAHATSWDRMTNILCNKDDVNVKIVSSCDTLCKTCPTQTSPNVQCNEYAVSLLDKCVKNLLDLKDGEIYSYKEQQEKLKKILDKNKHAEICEKCAWWIKGLCQNTFSKQL